MAGKIDGPRKQRTREHVIADQSVTVSSANTLTGKAVGIVAAVTMPGSGGNTIGGCTAGAVVPPDSDDRHRPRARFHAQLAHDFGPVEEIEPLYLRVPDAVKSAG